MPPPFKSGVFVMESLAQSSTSLRSAAGRAIIPAIITIFGLYAR